MRYNKKRLSIYFFVVTVMLLDLANEDLWGGVAIMAAFLLFGMLIMLFPKQFYGGNSEPNLKSTKDYLTYYGDQLDFSKDDLISILNRHSTFYSNLDDTGKEKFIHRLTKFIEDKTFKVHDKSGFKEMPVLISATAIQVSFGLEEYLLSHFIYIHIHPE